MRRRLYYLGILGAAGFGYGQGIIVMWPEWSAWTWWALATAVLPFLALPTIWDRRQAIAERVGLPWRNYGRITADMHALLAELDSNPIGIHDRYRRLTRLAMLLDKYPQWFPEDIDERDIRDAVHSVLGSIERRTGRVIRTPE